MRAQLEPVSRNGGRKIAVFEAQNFNEGRLIIVCLFLGKSTLQSPVSYSVIKNSEKNVKFRRCGTLRSSAIVSSRSSFGSRVGRVFVTFSSSESLSSSGDAIESSSESDNSSILCLLEGLWQFASLKMDYCIVLMDCVTADMLSFSFMSVDSSVSLDFC